MSDITGDEFELGIPLEDVTESEQNGKFDDEEDCRSIRKPHGREVEHPDYDSDENEDVCNAGLGLEIEDSEDGDGIRGASTGGEEDKPSDVRGEDGGFIGSQQDGFGERLDGISRQLDGLRNQFLTRLENDAYKDKLIDTLHRELQAYKNDLVKKHVQSMVMDVIKVIDDIRKLSDHYKSIEPEKLEPSKLLQLLERIPGDLEDLFFYQGIKPFTCEGTEFDPTRQRVLKQIETSDPFEDKMVAASLKPGYEWDGKVIRPEIVAVCVYKRTFDDEKIGRTDE